MPTRLAFVIPDATAASQVFLMPLPDGPPVALRDTAAAIWILAAMGEPDVATGVGQAVGMARDEVAKDVEDFLLDLVEKDLLHARDD